MTERTMVIMVVVRSLLFFVNSVKYASFPFKYLNNSADATNAEAPPPNPLNIATISGMAVIATLIADIDPIMAPNNIPPRTHSNGIASILNRVAIMAINIPKADRKLRAIELQIKKMRLDQNEQKNPGYVTNDVTDVDYVISDRNSLINELTKKLINDK